MMVMVMIGMDAAFVVMCDGDYDGDGVTSCSHCDSVTSPYGDELSRDCMLTGFTEHTKVVPKPFLSR